MTEIIRDLFITALVHGGRGIGHHDGKAVFVPLTLPGDRVTCRVVKAKRRYVEAELLEVVEASAQRQEPPCPYFSSCGGCQWQHIPYREQTRWKEQLFADLLLRNKLVARDRIQAIVAAPDEWNYRNRAQLKCHLTQEGLNLGFYQRGSHSVVDVECCRLLAPPLQRTLSLLRKELPNLPCRDAVLGIDLACGDDDQVRIIINLLARGRRQIRSWLQAFASSHQINACIESNHEETPEVVQGDADLIVNVDQPELTLRYGPGGFVQVNSAQNRKLVAAMLDLVELNGTATVLDLFCGMGNFSLPLARRAGQVIGVEGSAASIANARINAKANNLCNLDFHAAEVSRVMSRFYSVGELKLAVLDPPRAGNYQVALELLKIRPEQILYLSCDPATLVRDLAPLVDDGYEVMSSQPFDLFPQTWHIESMTLLRRV